MIINGRRDTAEGPISLVDLLSAKNIRPEVSSVSVNRGFVKRQDFAETTVVDGDTVEIMIQLAGGDA